MRCVLAFRSGHACTTVHALTEALASIANGGSLFVDLSGLVFIDVGGLRALVTTAARMEGDHALTLCFASPHVRRLLELTGWHDIPRLRLVAGRHPFRTGS
jgi:anti-anti-sigma factor